MKHIPFEIICSIADRSMSENNLTEYLSHLNSCEKCKKEVDFQQSMIRTSQKIKLTKPSQNFTKEVISKIFPSRQKAWYSGLLNNLGNVIAMVAVLAFLAYIFSVAGSSGIQIQQPSDSKAMTEFYKLFQEGSQKLTNLLIPKLSKVSQPATPANTIRVALVAFVLLLIIDKVTQLFLRHRNL